MHVRQERAVGCDELGVLGNYEQRARGKGVGEGRGGCVTRSSFPGSSGRAYGGQRSHADIELVYAVIICSASPRLRSRYVCWGQRRIMLPRAGRI